MPYLSQTVTLSQFPLLPSPAPLYLGSTSFFAFACVMTFLKSWTFWIPTLVPQGLLCLGTWLTHLITVFPTCEVSAISMQRALPLACTHALWESCLQQGSLPLSLLMSLLHCLPHWLLHPHVGLYRFQLILERLLCSGHEVLRSLVQFSSAGTVSRPSI